MTTIRLDNTTVGTGDLERATRKVWTEALADPEVRAIVAEAAPDALRPRMGPGKCMVSGCSCVSYVEAPSGFDCARCGHVRSEHW